MVRQAHHPEQRRRVNLNIQFSMTKTISPDRAGYFCFYCHGLGAFERHQRRVWILIIGIWDLFEICDLRFVILFLYIQQRPAVKAI